MADRHDSRTGRDETLSPTLPSPTPPKDDPTAHTHGPTVNDPAVHNGPAVSVGPLNPALAPPDARVTPAMAAARTADKAKAAADAETARKAAADAADKAETDAIVTRRKAEDSARAAEREATRKAEADGATRRADPGRYWGLDLGNGQYSYADLPGWEEGRLEQGRERTLLIAGVNYEHVSDDADGIWLYRAMK